MINRKKQTLININQPGRLVAGILNKRISFRIKMVEKEKKTEYS